VKVLVTGATGEVGRHVTARLLAGGAAARALCRTEPHALPRDVEVARGDLTEPQTLEPAVAGVDAIVHCAAHLGDGGRALHCRVNVGGTRALLAAAHRAHVSRVVHLSTVAVYGRKGDGQVVRPADGHDPFPELRDDYAWSKIGAERWVDLYRVHCGLEAVVLRPGIVYGGRRDFVARVTRRAVGPLLVVLGSPGMLLPLVHVGDVAEAVLRALRTRSVPAEPLDLVGPGMPTQAEYLASWSAARGERVVPVYVPAARLLRRVAGLERPQAARALAYRLAWATQSVRYDGGPLARALGWCPSMDLSQGLARRPGAAAVAKPAATAAMAFGAPTTAPTGQP
jgi:2-alkyl-3-oxoalkanoate reductase